MEAIRREDTEVQREVMGADVAQRPGELIGNPPGDVQSSPCPKTKDAGSRPAVWLPFYPSSLESLMNDTKSAALGINYCTASGQLKKSLMFDLARRLGLDICFRCGKPISDVSSLSIEHKEAWMTAECPAEAFFDLDNVAFSHLSCNSAAAARPNKVYGSRKEQKQIADKRRRAWRCRDPEWNRRWYQKQKGV